MVAMDVVDTIRHREHLVDRELNAEARRERLIERLRSIYSAQGIEVTDAALDAGVDALEQERFSYTPPEGGPSLALARFYVRRDRWLKPLFLFLLLIAAIVAAWFFLAHVPEARERAAMPQQVQAAYTRAVSLSRSEEATQRAETLRTAAAAALADDDYAVANLELNQLRNLVAELERRYEIRIVSRPNELSGVWRVPDVNPDTRNYYLIVEAVDERGSVLMRSVRNEEDGRLHEVSKWGIRVDEATFESVAADKKDDGIIQDYVVATKDVGQLEPDYRIPTSGATITEW